MCGFERSGSHQLQGTGTGEGSAFAPVETPRLWRRGRKGGYPLGRTARSSAAARSWGPAAAGVRADLRQLSREGAGMMEEAATPSPDTVSAGAQRAGPGSARGGRRTAAAGLLERGLEAAQTPARLEGEHRFHTLLVVLGGLENDCHKLLS